MGLAFAISIAQRFCAGAQILIPLQCPNEEPIAQVMNCRRHKYAVAVGNMGRNPDGSAADEGRPKIRAGACENRLARCSIDVIDFHYIDSFDPKPKWGTKRLTGLWATSSAPERCDLPASAKPGLTRSAERIGRPP